MTSPSMYRCVVSPLASAVHVGAMEERPNKGGGTTMAMYVGKTLDVFLLLLLFLL